MIGTRAKASLALLAWVFACLVGPTTHAQSVDTGKIKVRAVAQRSVIAPGETVVIAVELDHPQGFHTWPNPEFELPEAYSGSYRTSVVVNEKAAGVAKIKRAQWPQPKPGLVPDPAGGGVPVKAPLFSGKVIAFFELEVGPKAPLGSMSIPLDIAYQTCDETVCYQPSEFTLEIPVTVADAAASAAAPGNEPALFAGYNAAKAAAAPKPAAPVAVVAQPRTLFGFGIGSSLLLIALAAMLGGAILNLTPCVLPIIPIKVMSLVEHAGDPRRRLVLGSWMALGVVVFWFLVGLPMVFFSSLNPNQLIFGHWWVTLGLGLLIALMGLGIMGLFSINLPQAVYMVNPKADTAHGSFLYGMMAGVLGLPCFGFVAGGLLAGSAALTPLTIMVIFTSLGIGMAAPYLILTARPGLISKIPRTGPASELVKQVLGLLILAAAAFFVTVAIRTALIEMPYLAESMAYWAVAFFVLLAGVWLSVRVFAVSKRRWPKLLMPIVSVALIALSIGYAYVSAADDRKDLARRQSGDTAWIPYTQARLDQGLAEGKVVVIDFTASWCINCKALKRGVLDKEPLYTVLHAPNVLILEGDLTSSKDPSWDKYRELGQTAPPGLAVYGPALGHPIIMNAYTQEAVIAAIDQARGRAITSKNGGGGP